MSGEDETRAEEAQDIERRVARLVGEETAAAWMGRPVELLANRTPREVIAAGDYLAVSRLVGAMEEMPIS